MKLICSHCNGTGTIRYFIVESPSGTPFDQLELTKHYDDCPYCERGIVEVPMEKALDDLVALIDHMVNCPPHPDSIACFHAYRDEIYKWVSSVKHMLAK